jgi:hypothetical protein
MLSVMKLLPVVSIAVYDAAGSPRPHNELSYSAGLCGMCGPVEFSAPAKDVVSKNFGSWAEIAVDPDRNGRFLCAPCAWALKATDLRYKTSIVTSDPTLSHPSQADLQQVLLRGPLPSTTAVMVPVSGKKAIILSAKWGMVASDFGGLYWQASHSAALKNLLRLRALGFRESGFVEPFPPMVTLMGLPKAERMEAQQLWQALATVRQDRTFLPLVTKISRSDS